MNLPIVINIRRSRRIGHFERNRDSTICGRRITFMWERQGKTDGFCKRCKMLSLRYRETPEGGRR